MKRSRKLKRTARHSFASWRAAGSLFGLAESVGGAALQCSFSSPNEWSLTLEPHALSLSHLTEISTARTFVHRIPSFPVYGQITRCLAPRQQPKMCNVLQAKTPGSWAEITFVHGWLRRSGLELLGV